MAKRKINTSANKSTVFKEQSQQYFSSSLIQLSYTTATCAASVHVGVGCWYPHVTPTPNALPTALELGYSKWHDSEFQDRLIKKGYKKNTTTITTITSVTMDTVVAQLSETNLSIRELIH